jgi:hypothetical protein
MTLRYNEIIGDTFCENSIRSVTIIDDQVLPYNELVKAINSSNNSLTELNCVVLEHNEALLSTSKEKPTIKEIPNIPTISILQSNNAAEICHFFQQKKIICDVDNVTENIDHEKIRKSDLVILDYHLAEGDSSRSRELLYNLSHTPHMNMVVVYTSENLDKSWYEIALSLRGTREISLEGDIEDQWDALCGGEDYPVAWREHLTTEDVEEIFTNNSLTKSTRTKIITSLPGKLRGYSKDLISKFIEEYLTDKYSVTTDYIERDIQSYNGSVKWVQAGSVFITLFNKNEQADPTDEPEKIWQRLKDALCSWNPSYYQLVLSEVQNQLEDHSLPMNELVSKGPYEQSAILWNILNGMQEGKLEAPVERILSNIHEYLKFEAVNNTTLKSFVADVARSTSNDIPDRVTLEPSVNGQQPSNQGAYDEYQKHLMQISLANYHSEPGYAISSEDCKYIAHAFNQELSSFDVVSDYITTGTILKENTGASWYLCVSPSCNTVAGQGTDSLAKRMSPQRVLRFLELTKCKMEEALRNATQGRYLFVNDSGTRLALSTVHETTQLPLIELGIVHNHDDRQLDTDGQDVSFFIPPMLRVR